MREDDNYIGGKVWNPFWRNTISVTGLQPPLQDIDGFFMHDALDHVTAAVESGCLRRNTWPEQLFVSRPVFDKFIDHLSRYDETLRIVDRWWCALAELADQVDEEGFIRTQEMADRLMEVFDDVNAKKPQWAAKKSKSAATKKAAPARRSHKAKH